MSDVARSRLACDACNRSFDQLDVRTTCECGGLLRVEHAAPPEQGAALRARFDARIGDAAADSAALSGVWRYRELVMPDAASVVSHPEGNTPLLKSEAVQHWTGVSRLWLKHEGHNPSGSFKDRGMTVAITQARRVGARAVACASTGNTSASMAAYAALGGLTALVLVPDGQIALGKLAQTLAYGARTFAVRGDFDACLRLVRDAQRQLGVYLVNSVNPWRLEGQKTIVAELLQQLRWEAPDWIVLPAGNLGNTAAFGKALRELHHLHVIDRIPRIAAVQAAGAAPFAASYERGFAERITVHAQTVASAIRIGDPASYDRAVAVIRETNGVVLSVPDEELLDAKRLVDRAGIGCEPASAASVAGVKELRRRGTIGADERVVAVLTGHVLKDPEAILRGREGDSPEHSSGELPIRIEPTLTALTTALDYPA